MVPKTIYIIMGRTGEYSDRRDWPVCAHKTEDAANANRDEMLEIVRRMGAGRGDFRAHRFPSYATDEEIRTEEEYAEIREDYFKIRGLDPNFNTGYTGTDYYIMAVPFHRSSE